MSAFPAVAFTKSNVKARWLAPFGSEEQNKKALGEPRGVYVGLTPSAVGDVLTLAVDATEGHSTAKVISSSSLAMITLHTEEAQTLDFTGHVSFPVYVVVKANYQINAESSATILTQTAAPNGRTEIGVCRIDSLGPMVIVTDPAVDSAARQTPEARATQPYGYMPGGSVEDLEAATASVAELIAARTDTVAFAHPDLASRLTADFAPARIAGNMGREVNLLQGNDYPTVGSSQRVSTSFLASSRTEKPLIDIAPGGDESTTGVIAEIIAGAGTNDTVRNVVAVQDVDNCQHLIDKATGLPVFGRLQARTNAIPAALTFDATATVATSIDVSGVVEIGDAIEDLDGAYQEVIAVTAVDITMASSNTGTQGVSGVGALNRRRFDVNLVTKTNGAETAHSIIREVALSGPFSLGTQFDAGETITFNAKTATVVRDTPDGSATLLYIPTDPLVDIVLAGENIVGGTSASEVLAAGGTPTSPAPTLRYYFPTFLTVDIARFNAVSAILNGLMGREPEATENIRGTMLFAPNGGTDFFTALQANDERLFGNIAANQSMGGFKITDLAAPSPGSNDAARAADIPTTHVLGARSSIGATGASGTAIEWNIQDVNNTGFVYTVSDTLIEVPSAGQYLVLSSVRTPLNDSPVQLEFYRGGSLVHGTEAVGGGGKRNFVTVSAVVNITTPSTEKLEIRVYGVTAPFTDGGLSDAASLSIIRVK